MNQSKGMFKFLLVLAACLTIGFGQAQEKRPDFYSKELSFTTDNDAYLLQNRDAYYTNGFFIRFTAAGEKKGSKITRTYQLGQMMYTPFIRNTQSPKDIDRPYCGYLLMKYNQTKFLTKDDLLQYDAVLGMVGPASLGENLQNSYHKLLGYSSFRGWQYQVQNAAGVDLGMTYARTLWEDSSWIKLLPVVQTNLGTTFTNARLGMYTCLGIFEKNENSALWNARVQTKATQTRKKYEFFVYWYPQILLQGYNATVEGGMFDKNVSAVLSKSERWMFQQNWGLCFSAGQWTARLELVYQTKEAVTQRGPQRYGSIQISYRMH